MTLQQIMCFLEIVKTSNFTQAAQNLYVSQSALSYSIQALEQEIGVPLFIRRKSSRKVELTEYGTAFAPYCRQAVGALDEGKHCIEQMRNPLSGIVTVMYSYMNCHALVPHMFRDFLNDEEHSEIVINFDVNHEKSAFEEDVVAGKADLALAATRKYPGLETHPVAVQELKVYVAVENPLAQRETLTLEDIREEQLIGYYKNTNLTEWITQMYHNHDMKPNQSGVYQEWAAQIACVSVDQGVAILPELPVDDRSVRMIDLDDPMSRRPIYLLWPKDRALTEAAEHIRNYCIRWSREHYGSIEAL